MDGAGVESTADAAPGMVRGVRLGSAAGLIDAASASGSGSAADAPFSELLRRWLLEGRPADRVRLVIRSGDPATDATLHSLAPAFVAMLEDLTDRQREVARLLLLEGRRRAQIAEALRISRPTVSVMVDRARLEELPGVAAALDAIFAAAVAPAHPIAR